MALGPIEMLMIKFPGDQIGADLVPALSDLVRDGLVHIVDILFIRKDAAGSVQIFEFNDLLPAIADQYAPLLNDITELLNEDDAYEMASSLEPGSSAGVMLFENIWAARFAQAVRDSSGEVLINERIPHEVVEEIIAATA